MEKTTVFLGGTCNGSTWRERLIPMLTVSYFNPVVEDWNEEAYEREKWHRANDDICLYVITPLTRGFYSIAEVVQDSNARPDKTVICILREDDGESFDNVQWKSLTRVKSLCEDNGTVALDSLEELAKHINSRVH